MSVRPYTKSSTMLPQGTAPAWTTACPLGSPTRGRQGLTLVHLSAQPKPFLVTEATASVHFSAQPETFSPMRPPNSPQKVLTLSRKVDHVCRTKEMLTLS